MGDAVRKINLLVLAIVEARHRDRHWRYPVGHGKAGFRALSIELADADQNIRGRNLESEVVKRLFTEAVQVRIPRLPSSDLLTSSPPAVHHFFPAHFPVDP